MSEKKIEVIEYLKYQKRVVFVKQYRGKSRGKTVLSRRTESRDMLCRGGLRECHIEKRTHGLQNDVFRVPTKHIAVLRPYNIWKKIRSQPGGLYGRLKDDDALDSGPLHCTRVS